MLDCLCKVLFEGRALQEMLEELGGGGALVHEALGRMEGFGEGWMPSHEVVDAIRVYFSPSMYSEMSPEGAQRCGPAGPLLFQWLDAAYSLMVEEYGDGGSE